MSPQCVSRNFFIKNRGSQKRDDGGNTNLLEILFNEIAKKKKKKKKNWGLHVSSTFSSCMVSIEIIGQSN